MLKSLVDHESNLSIIGHLIFSATEQISSSQVQIWTTYNAKLECIETKNPLLPYSEGLKRAICQVDLSTSFLLTTQLESWDRSLKEVDLGMYKQPSLIYTLGDIKG